MGGVKGGARRPYRSSLRDQSARRTRQAVVAAARELFVSHGYAATSLADIAIAAGVARPTVFAAFGSKAGLLRQVLDEALAGDDEPIPVAQRPWLQPVWRAENPAAALDAYATVCTIIGGRAAAVFEAVRCAAHAEPEVAELSKTLQRNRRTGAQMVLDHLRTLGPLRGDLPTERAVDVLWLLTDPAHYDALIRTCGWPEDVYRDWLSNQMRQALLPLPH